MHKSEFDITMILLIIKGLLSVLTDDVEKLPSLTVISDGAECILIRKSFFMKSISGVHLDRLRREVCSYYFYSIYKHYAVPLNF